MTGLLLVFLRQAAVPLYRNQTTFKEQNEMAVLWNEILRPPHPYHRRCLGSYPRIVWCAGHMIPKRSRRMTKLLGPESDPLPYLQLRGILQQHILLFSESYKGKDRPFALPSLHKFSISN